MNKENIITPSEAREIAEKTKFDNEIQKVNELINKACKKGNICTEVPELSNRTKEYLKNLGYQLYKKEVDYGYDAYIGDFIKW